MSSQHGRPKRIGAWAAGRIALSGLALLLAAAAVPGLSAQSSPDQTEFFEKKVRPLFAAHCLSCHGEKQQLGGLRLDSREALLKGGSHGGVLGNPEKSLLLQVIGYGGKVKMPPSGKLSEEQIADLTQWVKQGAPWPDAGVKKVSSSLHWSFQPVKKPAVPKVKNAAWVKSPIDAFVLAKLEAKGLTPSQPADKRPLIRRVTFDLIGLPPTPEEIHAFLADKSPRAYEKVVDRLLTSPHYGERWARHWLDLVRFAETEGHEFDFEKPNAYRYRDYVIRALNADIPYHQFVKEHIAGDLLPTPRLHPTEKFNESILGTGFWWLGEGKHSPVDLLVDEAERVDNQIDVFGKAFLGLGVACARCHDHKFDPIPTKDYYALAGFLHSSRYQQAAIDAPTRRREIARELAVVNAQMQSLLPGEAAPESPAPEPPGSVLFEDFEKPGYPGWYVTGEAFGDGPTRSSVVCHAAQKSDWAYRQVSPGVADSGALSERFQGALRSKTFRIEKPYIHYVMAGREATVRLVIDSYQLIRAPIYGGLSLTLKGGERSTGFTMDVSKWVGHRAYIEFLDEGAGYIAVDRIVFSDKPLSAAAPVRSFTRLVEIPDSAALTALREQRKTLEARITEPICAMAMADGTGEDAPIYLRGNPKTPGEAAPRRFLTVLAGEKQPALTEGSGRLALAQRLASPSNPLLSRVIVNRLWHHHFGAGIVRTPDDFGVMGQRPTHPELLDWLAATFVTPSAKTGIQVFRYSGIQEKAASKRPNTRQPEHLNTRIPEYLNTPGCGWSLKKMHRLMVLSNTYRMASRGEATAEARDPQNKLRHRMPARRLEAECIRDAILAVSGRLDKTLYGPSVPPYLTPFMEGRGRPEKSGPLDGNGRRSIYIGVRRNFLTPMFLAFDYPVPFSTMGRRTVSNVPAQALTLMNNPLVIEQAGVWARRVLAEPGTSEQRIARLFEMAFGRLPTAQETQEAQEFLREQSAPSGNADDLRAWSDLCHVLFNAKEFLFVN